MYLCASGERVMKDFHSCQKCDKFNSIKNILALRYDFNTDYSERQTHLIESYKKTSRLGLESSICNVMDRFVKTYRPKRVSVALSGGIDSVLMTMLFHKRYPEIKLTGITGTFNKKEDDIKFARSFCRENNMDHVTVYLDNFMESLPKQISIIGEPKINYYWYDIVKEARNHSRYLLTGDGGDELFAGYVFRYKKFNSTISGTSREAVLKYLDCHQRDWVPDQKNIFGSKVIPFDWSNIVRHLEKYFEVPQMLDNVLNADFHGKLLHDIIPAYEKIYHYTETVNIAPMLDPLIVSVSRSIPTHEKFDGTIGKIPLRGILEKHKQRTLTDKFGFAPDWKLFWKRHGKQYVKDYVLNGHLVKEKILNESWVAKHLETNDIRYMTRLLHVMSFEIYHRIKNNLLNKDESI